MRRQLIDWRFLVALAGLLLVAAVVLGLVGALERIDALVEQRDAERDRGVADRAQAGRERDRLLANQSVQLRRLDRTLDELAQLQRRQSRLLAYLQRAGIDVPAGLFAEDSAGRKQPGGFDAGTVPSEQKRHPAGRPPAPSTPRPDPEPPGPQQPPRGPLAPVEDLLDDLLREAPP